MRASASTRGSLTACSSARSARRRRHRHEQRVEARVVGQLGMECAGEHAALADNHRVAVVAREHLDLGPVPLDPRGADEHRAQRLGAEPVDLELGLEALQLAAEGVAARDRVHQAEVLAVADDHPGAGAEHGAPALGVGADRGLEPVALDRLRDRRALAAGDHEPVEVGQLGRALRTSTGAGAERAQHPRVGREVALRREDADPEAGLAGHYQPRCWSSAPSAASWAMSSPRIGSPSPAEAAATRSGSSKWVVASTIARARRSRVLALEDPRADEVPLGAELHHQRRVGRRRDAAGAEQRHRQPPAPRRPRGRPRAARRAPSPHSASSSAPSECSRLIPPVISRMWRTASTMLPVPASPLERIIAAPSPSRRSASPRLVAPQTNGTSKASLSMWLRLVGGGQHLGLVDVVDLERLQHLGLGEVADPRLRHHRDRHRLLDLLDHPRARHPGDAAVGADVGRHALQRHHRDRRPPPRRSSPARPWSRP